MNNSSHTVQHIGPQLRSGRILSIDIFRALTVLVMIMVNEWSGIEGLPKWMRHMAAEDDAMSFVDVVFPAFLFIVGMSIPFALQQRMAQVNNFFQVQKHVLQRAIGLVVIGVFMVNAADGYNAAFMLVPVAAWALFSYLAAFLIWGSVSGGSALRLPWRIFGAAILVALALLYRGGVDGATGMTAQWWGILGLIGWAYMLGSLMFQLTRGRVLWLMLCIALCAAYFIAHRSAAIVAHPWLAMLFSQEGHFSHAAIVLSGCVTAMLFFDERIQRSAGYRFLMALAFALALALVASVLRPEFKISKIYATPSWALYSAASCVLIFAILYQLTDRGGRDLLPGLLAPVAANPLVAYLIPFVVGSAMQLAGWVPSAVVRSGGLGVMYGVAYSLLVALIVKIISSHGIRLRI